MLPYCEEKSNIHLGTIYIMSTYVWSFIERIRYKQICQNTIIQQHRSVSICIMSLTSSLSFQKVFSAVRVRCGYHKKGMSDDILSPTKWCICKQHYNEEQWLFGYDIYRAMPLYIFYPWRQRNIIMKIVGLP